MFHKMGEYNKEGSLTIPLCTLNYPETGAFSSALSSLAHSAAFQWGWSQGTESTIGGAWFYVYWTILTILGRSVCFGDQNGLYFKAFFWLIPTKEGVWVEYDWRVLLDSRLDLVREGFLLKVDIHFNLGINFFVNNTSRSPKVKLFEWIQFKETTNHH